MMKKLFFLLSLTMLSLPGKGQIIFTQEDLPKIGDRLVYRTSNQTSTFTQANAGEAQTWNFSGFSGQLFEQAEVVNPTGQPGSELFPDANLATTALGGSSFLYSQVTDTSYLTLGTYLDGGDEVAGNFTVIYQPPRKEYTFPLSYGTQFSSSSESELIVGEISPGSQLLLKQSENVEVVVDGYGTVSTFQGEFPVLRLKRTAQNRDSTFLLSNGMRQFFGVNITTTFSYEWISDTFRGAIVSVELAANSDNTLATVSVLDTALSVFGQGVQYEPPVADFFAVSTSPGSFTFEDRSTGPPDSWFWDFGDGSTSTLKNPRHQYTQEGTFAVCLTVTNPEGESTACDSLESGVLLPTAGFEYSPQPDGTVAFSNTSTGPSLRYAWDFGDGSTSTERDPDHTYDTVGVYTVCLIVSNDFGADTVCQSIDLTAQLPVADFTFTDQGSGSFQFEDLSTNNPILWLWDFGDGNSSGEQNPRHDYQMGGTYKVCLTVFNNFGADTLCQNLTVNRLRPAADFTVENTGPGSYQFTDASTNGATSWTWTFGDGNSATAQNPIHQYQAAGEYEVCLISANEFGADTICQLLTVPDLTPMASIGVEELGKGLYQFNDQSTNMPASWQWDFGDGNTSTEQAPQHQYLTEGNFDVCLRVANDFGADSTCIGVAVTNLLPDADFSWMEMDSSTFLFQDASANDPESWQWDFGDGTTSNLQNPEHRYDSSGVYTICLVVGNAYGTDTICQMINVILTSVQVAGVELDLQIAPNPFGDQLRVSLQGTLPESYLELRIRNALGQEMWSGQLRQAVTIEANSWTPGWYLLEIRNPEGRPLARYPLIHR